MKAVQLQTNEASFVFGRDHVQRFVKALSDSNPIYTSVEEAKRVGLEDIPLPPTMPHLAYKWLNIPWILKEPVIHRKQKNVQHQLMYANKPYTASVALTDVRRRQGMAFVSQTLSIWDSKGNLCFSGITELLAGDVKWE